MCCSVVTVTVTVRYNNYITGTVYCVCISASNLALNCAHACSTNLALAVGAPQHLHTYSNQSLCPNKQRAFMSVVPPGSAVILLLLLLLLLHTVGICTLPLGRSDVSLPAATPLSKFVSSSVSGGAELV